MAVQLDPRLMEVLACPSPDHAPLAAGTAADPDAHALTCTACGRSFPVDDGIPVLLLEEVLPGTGPSGDPPGGAGGAGPGPGASGSR